METKKGGVATRRTRANKEDTPKRSNSSDYSTSLATTGIRARRNRFPNQGKSLNINVGLSILVALALFTMFFYNSGFQSDEIGKASGVKTPASTTGKAQMASRGWKEPPLHSISLQEFEAHPTLPPAKRLKVDYPIFVASFSKSGTTSTYYAFECYLGPEYVAHRWTTDANHNGNPELIGRCMEQNVLRRQPPLWGCGVNHFNRTQTVVWTDTAYIGGDNGCYNPNMEALDAIWEAYPTATLLLVRRNATAWFQSANSPRAMFIRKWANKCSRMPNTRDETVWVDFYNNYTQQVRQFAEQHKGQMKYVEIELENPHSGQILQDQIGLPASCWRRCPSSFTMKGCTELNETRKEQEV